MKKIIPSRIMDSLLKSRKTPIHRDEMEEIKYSPSSVKDLLIDMKDKSDLIIDLAYSAIIFNSREFAEKVRDIEVDMDELLYRVRISSMLAARTPRDAEQLSGILQYASGVEGISDAAMDMVDQLFKEDETTPLFSFMFEEADEKIDAMIVSEGSDMVGKYIRDLQIESDMGVRIIAIKRGNRWLYDVSGGTRIHAGDMLVCRGVEEGIKELRSYAEAGTPWGKYRGDKIPTKPSKPMSKGTRYLLEMKNVTELMVDLATSSMLYNDKELAEEVYILHHRISKLYDKIVKYSIKKFSPDNLDLILKIISVLNGMYDIGDSAKTIANVVLRDIEPHPIIREIVRESDVAIARATVMKDSPLDGKRLGEIKLASETGMWVFAIKRKDGWIFGPNEATKIIAGDVIFAKGPVESFNLLYELAGCYDSCEIEVNDE